MQNDSGKIFGAREGWMGVCRTDPDGSWSGTVQLIAIRPR